jgi:hypothetical protein
MNDFIKEFIENYNLSNPTTDIIKIDELLNVFINSFIFKEYFKAVVKDNYKIDNNNVLFNKPIEQTKQIKKDITQEDILNFINKIIFETHDDFINISKLYINFKVYHQLKKYVKTFFINLIKTNYKTDAKTHNIILHETNAPYKKPNKKHYNMSSDESVDEELTNLKQKIKSQNGIINLD